MPSLNRRTFLTGSIPTVIAASGCSGFTSPQGSSEEGSDPHWVKMYLGDREETHNVTVTITSQDGDTVFEKAYELLDSNEADEDATFPASRDPETVVITVDGSRFERDWPGFEQPALPCDGANEAGIELYVENGQDDTPEIRLEADCQSITGV